MFKSNIIITLLLLVSTLGISKENKPLLSVGINSNAFIVPFEGLITTKVSFWGLDLSTITENIDYSKGNIQQQIRALVEQNLLSDFSKVEQKLKENPMVGLAMFLTPPKAFIYINNQEVLAKTKGIGYDMQHYHNLNTDKAFINVESLINKGDEVTAEYSPSQGFEDVFTDDKLIDTEKYNINKQSEKIKVAGYDCSISTYLPKSIEPSEPNALGLPSVDLKKLVVYTSADIPKSINFSHPYYIPEEHGILRIDVYFDKSDTPTMIYEAVSVEKKSISPEMLKVKTSSPLYKLTDFDYSMKVMGIMFGGMSQMEN